MPRQRWGRHQHSAMNTDKATAQSTQLHLFRHRSHVIAFTRIPYQFATKGGT